jgi:hemerythrin-like domain-containing protein
MDHRSLVSRTLDDEHRANLALLDRVEQAFGRMRVRGSDELRTLAGALARQVEQDIGRHFAFEERELFPRMTDAGDGDMAALLALEHASIRAVADELLPLARAAEDGTLDAAGWDALARGALEIAERQVAHIQKESMALLPLLVGLLDENEDRELAFA